MWRMWIVVYFSIFDTSAFFFGRYCFDVNFPVFICLLAYILWPLVLLLYRHNIIIHLYIQCGRFYLKTLRYHEKGRALGVEFGIFGCPASTRTYFITLFFDTMTYQCLQINGPSYIYIFSDLFLEMPSARAQMWRFQSPSLLDNVRRGSSLRWRESNYITFIWFRHTCRNDTQHFVSDHILTSVSKLIDKKRIEIAFYHLSKMFP